MTILFLFYITHIVLFCQEESILLQKEVYTQFKSNPSNINLLTTMGRLYCHESVQRYEDALEHFYEVRRMKSEIYGSMNLEVASALNNIAYIYLQLDEFDKSLSISKNSIDIAYNGGRTNKEMCVAWTHKANAQEKLGRYSDAIATYEKVLNLQPTLAGFDAMENAAIYKKIANVYLSSDDVKNAISNLEKAILVERDTLGEDSKDLAKSYRKLGECYGIRGNLASSVKCHTKALRIFKHTDDKEGAAVEHNKLGAILQLAGNNNKSMEHYMASLWHAREAKLPSTNPVVADTIRNVASFQ